MVIWYRFAMNHMIFQDKSRTVEDPRLILEKDHTVVILNVKEKDEGNYYCNAFPGNVTLKVKLVVLQPLEAYIYDRNGYNITHRKITYNESDRIEIECKANDNKRNQVDYKWSADGNRLTSTDNLKIDGGKLTIERASYDDIRVYQCLADDGIDGVAHATFTVNVKCKCDLIKRTSIQTFLTFILLFPLLFQIRLV